MPPPRSSLPLPLLLFLVCLVCLTATTTTAFQQLVVKPRSRLLQPYQTSFHERRRLWLRPNRRSPLGASVSSSTSSDSLQSVDDVRLKKDLEKIRTALNTDHKEVLVKLVLAFSPLGEVARSKNFWYGDSFRVSSAEVEDLSVEEMRLQVSVTETGFFGGSTTSTQTQTINLPQVVGHPVTRPSEVKLALIQMCNAVGCQRSTGPIYGLRVDSDRWDIPNNLFLNNCPHSRSARSFVYTSFTRAIDEAINDPTCPKRMRISVLIPETNAAFDTYRIGTILEMCREAVIDQAIKGKRVKFCVQGRLGEGIFNGLPLSLNGCRLIMENMDWRSQPGEELEGILGQKIFFGDVGPQAVEDEDEVFLVVSPQNMIGVSIIPLLQEMADKAGDRPFIIFNPNLKDRPSSNDIMQVRGREERTDFINSFHDIFVFNTQHEKAIFKINGAVGKAGHNQPWVIYRLEEEQASDSSVRKEYYVPTRVTDKEPETVIL